MTYAIQKTTASGLSEILLTGLSKERADHLLRVYRFAEMDGATYEILEDR